MKVRLLITLFLLCSLAISQTQNIDSVLSEYAKYRGYDTLSYTLCKNKKWAKRSTTKTYEDQGKMYSYCFAINDDSTFVFQAFYEPGIDIAVGKWNKLNDSTINVAWD